MTQPEALRLADALIAATGQADAEDDVIHVARWFVEDAAAELRRLHAENEALREANDAFGKRQEWWNEKMFTIEQQRDALLEAMKGVLRVADRKTDEFDAARAAIKQAEGEEA